MEARPEVPAAVTTTPPSHLALSGRWTASGLAALPRPLAAGLQPTAGAIVTLDATLVDAMDTAGAWTLQHFVQRMRTGGAQVEMPGLRAEFARLLDAVAQHADAQLPAAPGPARGIVAAIDQLGRRSAAAADQGLALLAFVGEGSLALAGCITHPKRLRWRPILFNIRSAGFDALPIVGLLSFLLGVVVAYQAADQLRRYGANIFVADLVGLSMLREFAPLMTAIIIAGRSGSAYAAQIGTMAVTEEIDAMRTLGIAPLELLVLPKLVALVITLPLLTVFADLMGVAGGMVMARAQLGVSFNEFLDRFSSAISVTTYLIGIGKAPVFAAIIAIVGCFQGMRTRGGADSVGRHTTRSVVQAIFLVIVADALFSVAFSVLGL
jgi:phospholipid/cholesterol/gamma-HCH transport system permease protein